jgi:hypothetical protein
MKSTTSASHRLHAHETSVVPKRRKKWKLFKNFSMLFFPLLLLGYIGLATFAYLTNPFTKHTIVQEPFQTALNPQGQLELTQQFDLHTHSNRFYNTLVWLKSGQHIFNNVYVGGKKAKGTEVDQIIAEIHELRFNPAEPYLISGDHFSTLYPRSLGIFYHSLLDPRTALNQEDWLHREQIYAQTTAYALEAYKDAPALTTTIVPVGTKDVSFMNVYRPPSDTLFSLLYALDVMSDTSSIENAYPFSAPQKMTLNTSSLAKNLTATYKLSLQKHLQSYLSSVVDPQTGLVRTDILLSSVKDVTQRQSSFYDNVVLWKTQQLAQKLDITPRDDQRLSDLKKKILARFWVEDQGCFLEDLSAEAQTDGFYSSDWLIVLSTQFLDPAKPEERKYLEKCVAYIQKEKLDQPFGLKYQTKLVKSRQFPVVRYLAPQYGSTTIWSNWGQEYIKLLALLYKNTGDEKYLVTAQTQLDAYTQNIEKYKCYPEVYDKDGQIFKNLFYKSVCQTGWVVSYEQAREMVRATAKQ